MKTLHTGEVARQAGIGIGAVRLYERRGLIPAASRSRSGYRLFPEDTVLRVRVIRSARALGFTLREMSDLFSRLGPGGMSGKRKDAMIDAKLREVDAKIRSLEHVRTLLLRLRSSSGDAPDHAECALAEAALGIVSEMEKAPGPRPVFRSGGAR